MQELHQTTIKILNREIENLNSENGMVTPKVMKTAFQKKGFGLPYRLRLGRLQEDGCHLTPETTGDVIRVLRDIMSVNRINLYDRPNYVQSYISLDDLSDNLSSDFRIESSSSNSGADGQPGQMNWVPESSTKYTVRCSDCPENTGGQSDCLFLLHQNLFVASLKLLSF